MRKDLKKSSNIKLKIIIYFIFFYTIISYQMDEGKAINITLKGDAEEG